MLYEVITDRALEMLAVDKKGLDEMDRRILLSIIDVITSYSIHYTKLYEYIEGCTD